MAWNRLPVECVQIILDQLAEDKDIYSLNALLRVNKHLCDLTLPYLYEDPFSLAASKFDEDHDNLSRATINKLLPPLIRTLLSSVDPAQVTDLLRAAYWDDIYQEANSFMNRSGIDYLRYLRHFYPDSVNHALFRNFKVYKENTRLKEYVRVKGYEKQFRDQELDLESNPYEDSSALIVRYLSIPLRNQLTWALCSPILEKIQRMTIPLSDLARYQSVIHRLTSLAHIKFKMDQKISHSRFITQQLQQDNPEYLEQRRQIKVALMESMVEFVRDHTERFPHILLEADCPQDNTWAGARQIAPQTYIEQFQAYLPSLIRPTVLDKTNWSQFLAKTDTTDLRQVQTVIPPRDDPIQWLGRLRQQCLFNKKSFLQRCRGLKTVDMISLGPDSFKWAPQEKQERQEYYAKQRTQSLEECTATGLGSMSLSSLSRPIPHSPSLLSEPTVIPSPPPPPQPLEEGILRCYWEGLGTELDDMAVSFPETLTKLVIQGPRAQFAVQDIAILPNPRIIGESWLEPLPRLKKLALFKLEETFRLAPFLLSRCPALEELRIQDKMMAYNCDQILAFGVPRQYPVSSFSSEPGTSRLKIIDLQGWSALCFHPETLRHTPELQTLVLMTEQDRHMRNIIPDPETLRSYDYPSLQEEAGAIRSALTVISLSQLDDSDDDGGDNNNGGQAPQPRPAILRRPCWAWDWDLPNLTRIRLTSEFAYRFQVKMLVGCPRLESLNLSIAVQGDHTPDMTEEQLTGPDCYYYTHKRTLTIAEFLKPGLSTSTMVNNDGKGKGKVSRDTYISCPSLKSFLLSGRWSISDEVLEFLFSVVMPNLEDVVESQCLGFTFEGWLRATSRLKDLKAAMSGRKLPEETLFKLGMVQFVQDYRTAPQYVAIEKIVDGEEQVTFLQVPGADGLMCPRPSGVYSLSMSKRYVFPVDHYIDE
ncbi:hypothetical protein BGX33_007742 [Mortierella sp. NVP41]|nr:hypothetical protein BGX33_007742 [Mortierella sp. NVP41]